MHNTFTGPSTPAATITALDEKLTDADATPPTRFLYDHETLPYWLVNVPRSQWTAECPSFLRDQPPKNIRCLATPDDHWQRQDWEAVQEIVSEWSLHRPARMRLVITDGGALFCLGGRDQPNRTFPTGAE